MLNARRRDLFCRDDFLPLLSELCDSERDDVAGLQENRSRLHAERDARRRARDNDVARFHHEELRAVPDKMFAAEDHRARVAALTALAVHVEPHVQVLRILDFIFGDEPRPDRAEGLAAFALVPLASRTLDLEYALRHVVRKEIAGDRILRLVLGEIARALAYDDAELNLVVELADSRGVIVSSFGPLMQLVTLLKMIGSFGIGIPASAAWSE